MNEVLKKAIEKLERLGIEHKVLKLGLKAYSSEDVARLYDNDPREIAKTLIVKTNKDEIYALIVPGIKRIDTKKLKKHIRFNKVRFLREDELKETTSFVRGTVCPVLIENIPILVDSGVFKTKNINFGSGDLYYGIEIKSEDLLKCINARIVDITED